MAVNLAPIGNDAPFVDASGNPLTGGLLYFYVAGSDTLQDTYTTHLGNVANANPVVLNSNGYPSSGATVVEIWFTAGVQYKAILKTSAGVTVWTRDYLSGINDASVSIDQWVAGPAPTYISATSFSLVGDQTSTFQVGRRLKTTNSGGTIYSTIKTVAFAAVTTVTVVNDSGTLDSGLSAVSYGLLSSMNPSTPLLADTYPVVSGSADKTKKLRFEVDGLTTDTTRTATWPDKDGTVAFTSDLTTVGTPVATTSGTTVNISTSIPAGIKEFVLGFIGVSTNGTDALRLQLSTAATFKTSGYNGSNASSAFTAGFDISSGSASNIIHGTVRFTLVDSSTNTWAYACDGLAVSQTNAVFNGGGTVALTTALDGVRITTSGGTNAFDAGSITLIYGF